MRRYLFQAAECLNHLHESYVIYNDLKPDNLLISDGRVRFSDFDTSVFLEDNTLNYASF